jgi:glycerophosphoryl diester phosphodiesterase
VHSFIDGTSVPFVIAHRGGVEDAPPHDDGDPIPENCDVAFARSVGLGVRYLESDIRTSADGVPVLHHDEDLVRVAYFGAKVSDLTWSEISRIRLPADARLMRLDEALLAWPSVRWNLDVKDDRSVDATVRVLTRAHALDRVCVASFSRNRLLRLRELLGPAAATCATWSEMAAILRVPGSSKILARRWQNAPLTPKVIQVPPSAFRVPLLTAASVAAAHALGLPVHAWTINTEQQMRDLLAIGVDGIITDHPETALQVVADFSRD